MKKFAQTNQQVKILLAVITLIVAAGILYSFTKKVETLPVTTTEIDQTKIPSGLPVSLPVEGGSEVLENSESVSSDGRKQSTRVVTTRKSVKEGVQFYREFFDSLGWKEIQTESSTDSSVTTLMKRDDSVLTISGRYNSTNKTNTITMVVSELAK